MPGFCQDIAIEALVLTLVIPGVDVIGEICVPAVKIRVWVPTPKLLDPFDGYWKWVTIVPAFCTPGVSSPEIDLGTLGPLYEEAPQTSSSTNTWLFDQDQDPWELGGFNTSSGAPFSLDPQLPPTANVVVPEQADEGQAVTMDGSGSSDPDDDTLTYSWDFGDDTTATGATPDHTYADDGVYTVTLTVADGYGGEDSASATVTVNNVAPTITASGDEVDENGAATVSGDISDPGTLDTFTVVIDWGEGAPETFDYPAGADSFSETHQYADDNPSDTSSDDYSISVTVTDDDDGEDSASATVTVNNVAPEVDAGLEATIDEGDTFLSSGSFTDPGADSWTATVDYGDNSGVQSLDLDEDKTFILSHTYDDNDVYTVTITVTDDDTGVGTGTTTVTVNNMAPTVDAGPDAENSSGQTHQLSASFTDPGIFDTHTAIIDWGDGSEPEAGEVSESEGAGTVTSSHQYFVPDTYTITVTVIDKDGDERSDSIDKKVLRLPVRIDIKPDSDPNPINIGNKGKLPVIIFGGEYEGVILDASTIDWSSVVFTEAPALNIGKSPAEELDGDGYLDQVYHFNTQETNLTVDSTEACLTGMTTGNIYFEGYDGVRIVPPKGKK